MSHDPASLFYDLAATNRTTFSAIIDDRHLPANDFIVIHRQSIREHYIRKGHIEVDDARASRAASHLWSYIQYLQAWAEQPPRPDRPHKTMTI